MSNQVTVTAGQAWGWVDFTFPSSVPVQAGTVWMGYHMSTKSNLTQLRYDPVGGGGFWNVNTYSSGASNPFGTGNPMDVQFSLYATYS